MCGTRKSSPRFGLSLSFCLGLVLGSVRARCGLGFGLRLCSMWAQFELGVGAVFAWCGLGVGFCQHS